MEEQEYNILMILAYHLNQFLRILEKSYRCLNKFKDHKYTYFQKSIDEYVQWKACRKPLTFKSKCLFIKDCYSTNSFIKFMKSRSCPKFL